MDSKSHIHVTFVHLHCMLVSLLNSEDALFSLNFHCVTILIVAQLWIILTMLMHKLLDVLAMNLHCYKTII